jgi:hypothetical protein
MTEAQTAAPITATAAPITAAPITASAHCASASTISPRAKPARPAATTAKINCYRGNVRRS